MVQNEIGHKSIHLTQKSFIEVMIFYKVNNISQSWISSHMQSCENQFSGKTLLAVKYLWSMGGAGVCVCAMGSGMLSNYFLIN